MIVLVTGGSRGIGAAIIKAFKAAGHTVANVSRTAAECDLHIPADLSDLTDRHGIIAKVTGELGGLDVLVNNAGLQASYPALEFPRTAWTEQIELLLTAPFDLCQQAAKYMLTHGGGRIINITSIAGVQGTRGIIAYSVAKAALIEMTKCLSNEWLPYGIAVNAIAPGFIETSMQTLSSEHKTAMLGRLPAGRFGTPEEVAKTALWLGESAEYISGITVPVDGGWLAR